MGGLSAPCCGVLGQPHESAEWCEEYCNAHFDCEAFEYGSYSQLTMCSLFLPSNPQECKAAFTPPQVNMDLGEWAERGNFLPTSEGDFHNLVPYYKDYSHIGTTQWCNRKVSYYGEDSLLAGESI